MPGLRSDVDPNGHLEYSVVYSDRALNHMSASFQEIMNQLAAELKSVYQADAVAIIPGSGTFAMEAVARQFAEQQCCLVIRNGWFSYRWTQILQRAHLPSQEYVLKARPLSNQAMAPFIPAPIEEVCKLIADKRPQLVFAPHVETSAGMQLPDDYIKQLAAAVHDVGGLLVLDCIASGAVWLDMRQLGIDVLISAPQKGWSAHPCCGLVMMNQRALDRLAETQSSSFSCDLKKWYEIMQAYESGGHAYHATMPTEGLRRFRDIMLEMKAFGYQKAQENQIALGEGLRQILREAGFKSVAAEGFQAPGVIVCYTDRADLKTGRAFSQKGIQIAAGVPLQCDEPADFQSFRIGLFGLDKLQNVTRTIESFRSVLEEI